MEKFINCLSASFVPKMKKLNENPWLSALSSAMMKSVPFILVGSIVYFYNVFVQYLAFLPDIGPIASYSFGLLSLIIAFLIGQQYMEKLGHINYLTTCGITSILILFMFVREGTVTYGRIGPSGMLVAIVSGIFTSLIFHLYRKLHWFEDTTLPDFVVNWINVVIPVFTVLLVTQIITVNLNIDIYTLVINFFKPIQNFAQTLPGMILLCLIPNLLYSLGVSSWMFSAISSPIYLSAITENIENVANGLPATNFTTNEAIFASGLIMMGGIGATLALNVLMCFSKSKQLKTLGRIFIGPSIFNINEPVVYGAPIVMNPILMIPYWLTAIVGPCLLWLIFSLKWLNVPSILLQANSIPIPIGTVMATQDLRGILWAIVFFLVYLAIWYPFFKAYEKQKIEEEINCQINNKLN